MSKIIEAQNTLFAARNCVECIFLAANDLNDATDPIQVVADIASKKIDEAIGLLDEYRESADASPVPDAPAAEPVAPARQTKRKGK